MTRMSRAETERIRRDFEIRVLGHKIRGCRLLPAGKEGEAGIPVVFLHEALGCMEMWRDFPERLAVKTGCEILLYDRIGHGRSGPMPSSMKNRDYLFRESLEWLPAVLDAVSVRHAVLFGHSDGGTIALMFAARYPERTACVITEAAHLFVDDLTLDGIRHTVRAYEKTDLRGKLEKYHGANTEPMFRRWKHVWLSEEFSRWNVEDRMPKVKAPVLAIQGKDDPYGEMRQQEAIVGGVGGVSRSLQIPECGHIPHFQAAGKVLEAAAGFIRGWRSENPDRTGIGIR